ncbi:ankyrin repeat domain-containing protein 40-like [Onthophagus taurus]|uniref:ankyrin repeat domain-containing protein 40-like n=1 Tax=Onthophagus taurus TaxID=166361 RepID=UPI000C20EC37|nr:ankyrin repeat domain-containing protein 40-like [Onthophagus taurus]
MSYSAEEKLREASALGDIEGIQNLLAQNVDVNAKNSINGWTALHWATKRNHETVVRILLSNGADSKLENQKGERPSNLSKNPSILNLLEPPTASDSNDSGEDNLKFTPNYIKNAPLNGQVDLGTKLRQRHPDFSTMPTTALPAAQSDDDLVLKIRVFGSSDPDFIEIEVPRWKLTYNGLQKICCEELEICESQVERIRKLPNVRLRKDADVKRLMDFQCLEIVLKPPLNEKLSNSYQSISTHKDQTILY